jgi:hypothetical protein
MRASPKSLKVLMATGLVSRLVQTASAAAEALRVVVVGRPVVVGRAVVVVGEVVAAAVVIGGNIGWAAGVSLRVVSYRLIRTPPTVATATAMEAQKVNSRRLQFRRRRVLGDPRR